MEQVVLWLYNYGTITRIAVFGKAGHDAIKCMKFLNDDQIKAHGKLPENIFYFLKYKSATHNRDCFYVDYTGGQYYPNDDSVYKKNYEETIKLQTV